MSLPVAGMPLTMAAPPLETERLRLRAYRPDDLAVLHSIWSDPAVFGPLGAEPATRQDAWMRLLRYGGMWPMLGYGYWAIEHRASGALIGDIGYADFKRAIMPPLDGMPEMGWVLASSAHGKGYASEALAAISAWGRQHFGSHRDCCIIAPDNAASIRVAEKAGFVRSHEAVYMEHPILVLVRDIEAGTV
jgi:RimJ/RimL family protein N-acetyltransferase